MDKEKLKSFKDYALSNGYSEDEVNGFLDMANSLPEQNVETAIPSYSSNFDSVSIAQPTPIMGTQNLGVEDTSKQMSRMLTPNEKIGLKPTQIKDVSKLGIEDESMQMSRMLTPEEQQTALNTLGETGNVGSIKQTGVIPFKAPITQPFGNRSRIEKYSGGVNLGTDFSVPSGTPLSVPDGEWVVRKATPGWNGGSGNYVEIVNSQTGESLGFEHLSKIGVQPGQKINGGEVVGLSGGDQRGNGRGNSTGAHASIPYKNPQGQYQDVLKSPYANSMFGS